MMGAVWRTSTRTGNGVNCVEVSIRQGEVWMRDTKQGDGPVLRFDNAQWVRFVKETVNLLPSSNGAVVVTIRSEVKVYSGRERLVCFHVHGTNAVNHETTLSFTAGEWTAFREGAKDGEFTLAGVVTSRGSR